MSPWTSRAVRSALRAGLLVVALSCAAPSGAQPPGARSAGDQGGGIESRVAALFEANCAHCHGGPDPYMGLGLTADRFYSNTVGRPSTERPSLRLVDPTTPDSSYLLMKVRGSPGIVGRRMPIGAPPLSSDEIALLEEWIRSVRTVDAARIASEPSSGRGVARPFGGWKLGNLPTTRMLGEGNILFLIEHRFAPPVSSGIESFFGVDGGANIMLSLGWAPIDELMLTLARSNVDDDVELAVKYRPFAQTGGGLPLALAIAASASVSTEATADTASDSPWRFALQLPMSHALTDEIGLALVPGLLLNPSRALDDESPLVTLGVGGQWHFYRFYSFFAQWTPIVSGYTPTSTFGFLNRYDSWSAGFDIALGGHDFQLFVGNSVGTATSQYMRGGDLDILGGDLRIGFNIYRVF